MKGIIDDLRNMKVGNDGLVDDVFLDDLVRRSYLAGNDSYTICVTVEWYTKLNKARLKSGALDCAMRKWSPPVLS